MEVAPAAIKGDDYIYVTRIGLASSLKRLALKCMYEESWKKAYHFKRGSRKRCVKDIIESVLD